MLETAPLVFVAHAIHDTLASYCVHLNVFSFNEVTLVFFFFFFVLFCFDFFFVLVDEAGGCTKVLLSSYVI